jgi:hypothetical protein
MKAGLEGWAISGQSELPCANIKPVHLKRLSVNESPASVMLSGVGAQAMTQSKHPGAASSKKCRYGEF